MSENRIHIEWIDICKGIGIALVVLGHCLPFSTIQKMLYSFHLPVFFIIAGMLYQKNSSSCCARFSTIARKAFKRLIIPYFSLAAFNLVIFSILHKLEISEILHYIIGILYSIGGSEWMPNCAPLWFLTCMFWIRILESMIFNVRRLILL